jgi:hypothetical protein
MWKLLLLTNPASGAPRLAVSIASIAAGPVNVPNPPCHTPSGANSAAYAW